MAGVITQARLDDIEQNVTEFADRRTVLELLVEVKRLRAQVALLEDGLLDIACTCIGPYSDSCIGECAQRVGRETVGG